LSGYWPDRLCQKNACYCLQIDTNNHDGSDIFDKNLLREQSIKNLIIIAIIGNGITEDAPDLASAIVEMQNKVNHAFVA